MTGDDRLRNKLEALERSAPADLPPRPSAPRPPRWVRISAPLAIVLMTAVVVAFGIPTWLGDLPLVGSDVESRSPAVESATATPSRTAPEPPQAAASVTFFGHWAECCYIEGALTYASLSEGPTHRTDVQVTAVDTWLVSPGSYELTLYHRPCIANCGNPGGVVGTCTVSLIADPGAALIVRITWHLDQACDASVSPRPVALPDSALIAGSLEIGDGCATVTDADAYRWSVELPPGFSLGGRTGVGAVYRADGSVAAEQFDMVLFLGTTTDAAAGGCASDLAYRAAEIGVIRPRAEILFSTDSVPLIRPVRHVSCDALAKQPGSTLRCAPAIAAAVRLVTGEFPPITSIEFHVGGYCPPSARCAAAGPNLGYVVIRSADGPMGDLWVEVIADDAGIVSPRGPLARFPPQLAPP